MVGAAALTMSAGRVAAATQPAETVERVGAPDRYATAVEAAKRIPVGATYVVLASGQSFPDALAAAPMSDAGPDMFAPVLLTPRDRLPAVVQDEIDRRLEPGDRVWVAGGEAAVSAAIDDGLRARGYEVLRLVSTQHPGQVPSDRYDTAAAAASFTTRNQTTDRAIVATGENFPDALAAASYAASQRVPILLTTRAAVPEATQDWLDAHLQPGGTLYVIGGSDAAVAPVVPGSTSVVRISGADRYVTAAAVARQLWNVSATPPPSFVLASGANFPDALAGGPLGGVGGAPTLLTPPDRLGDEAAGVGAEVVRGGARPRSWAVGGPAALADPVLASWRGVLEG
jgi:putative cell wall-binding protein